MGIDGAADVVNSRTHQRRLAGRRVEALDARLERNQQSSPPPAITAKAAKDDEDPRDVLYAPRT